MKGRGLLALELLRLVGFELGDKIHELLQADAREALYHGRQLRHDFRDVARDLAGAGAGSIAACIDNGNGLRLAQRLSDGLGDFR